MLMYAKGNWNASTDGKVTEVFNPATKEVIGTVPQAKPNDIEEVIGAAQKAKNGWARTAVWKRAEILTKFSNLVEKKRDELANLLSREIGKPIEQAEWEIDTAIRLFRAFPEHAKSLNGINIPLDHQPGIENDVYLTRKEPLGVIVGIIPFNFPVDLFSHKVAPALSSGNVMIVKPASTAPLTILSLTELLYEAGLPENVLQVVTGSGGLIGNMLAQSPLIDAISLTGSTETGIKVATGAAKHLSRVMLELGGNDPLIVFEDADIDLAVNETIFGRTLMNGQVCCSNKRMLIHHSKEEEFTSLLVDRLKELKYGNQLDRSVNIGPLIDEYALQTVNQQVKRTIEQGAKVALEGGVVDNTWYLPTVLTDVKPEYDISRDMEIFGPVFPILTFRSEEEALEIANSSIYGLNAAVFTKDVNRALNVSYQIESGIVSVNGSGVYRPDVSFFGGYKMSGHGGKEGLIGALEELTQVKSVALRNCLNIYN
ncbi:aldehyde dehydrogenase family protein [Peribacillus sp. NPDC058002]|uniref:aldehyde dehydrogenase family protein n=1 Tax=Peribacillus sp. NPDC058002 TaxID=3346301 RepID=UPI0036DAD2DA